MKTFVAALAVGMGLTGVFASSDARSAFPDQRKILIHSHNDYAQKRPFWGAYEAGADSIEADIYLVDGEILVAHLRRELKTGNTLRRLYLEPIRSVFRKNGGKIRADGRPLQLLVDLKDGKPALDRLVEMIEKEGLRPCFDVNGNPSAVRLVITGDYSKVKDVCDYPDFVFFDTRPGVKPADDRRKRFPMCSQAGGKFTKWRRGPMSAKDRARIRAAIDESHEKGCLFRLWGFPDHPEAWRLLQELGVDYINTDHPAKVAAFLRASARVPYKKR